MATKDQYTYHQRREQQERELARSAMSIAARNIHLELASRHAQLSSGQPDQRPLLHLVVGGRG